MPSLLATEMFSIWKIEISLKKFDFHFRENFQHFLVQSLVGNVQKQNDQIKLHVPFAVFRTAFVFRAACRAENALDPKFRQLTLPGLVKLKNCKFFFQIFFLQQCALPSPALPNCSYCLNLLSSSDFHRAPPP